MPKHEKSVIRVGDVLAIPLADDKIGVGYVAAE